MSNTNNTETLGVILVDYRSDPSLKKALDCLASVEKPPLDIVVIQNCPRLPPPEIPPGLSVRFLQSTRNMGFGRAVNQARQHLQTSFLMILNPDVALTPDALCVLDTYLKGHPEAAIVVPKLLDMQGRLQWNVRCFYDFPTLLLRRTPLGALCPNHPRLRRHFMSQWDHAEIREVEWALGACMLIRSLAVPETIFDPRFFLYFEDVDLCLRLAKQGWKVIYHPEAVAYHEHRRASQNLWSRAYFEHVKSGILFIMKHRGFGHPTTPIHA